MINLQYLRRLARAFYAVMILIGIAIVAYGFDARAQQTPQTQPQLGPRTQTGIGGGDVVIRRKGPGEKPELEIQEILVDVSTLVRNRVNAEGQYILGRESEAAALDEKFAGRNKTVVVMGQEGGGRTALVEEWIRLHPDVEVSRIDADKFTAMDANDAAASLKHAMLGLEKKNLEANGAKRYVLFIDNLSVLKLGQGTGEAMPLNELFTQINRGMKVPVIIETDEKTFESTIKDSRYKVAELTETLIVKPARFDAVLEHLRRNASQLEKSGAKFSDSAFVRAAGIATTNQRYRAFNWAYETLWKAGLKVQADLKAGVVDQSVLKGQIKRLERTVEIWQADLARATTDHERQTLQTQISEAQASIKDLETKVAPTGRTALGQDIATLEAQIKLKEESLKKLGDGGGFWAKLTDSSSNGEAEKITHEIAADKLTLNRLKKELSESGGINGAPVTAVGEKQVIEMAAVRLNKSAARLTANFEEGVRRVQEMNKDVFGQANAINALENAFKRIASGTDLKKKITLEQLAEMKRAGMQRIGSKPLSFWFFGATGVGKTEAAKSLAEKTGYELKIIDMTDYTESHNVAKLVGAPPGYVGYEANPELFAFVDDHPESIVLFDEIEKAHPSLFDKLIPLLDEGRLNRANGQGTTDFRRVIIIMTSNLAQKIGRWSEQELVDFIKKKKGISDETVNALSNNRDMNLLRETAYIAYITDAESMAAENRPPIRPEIAARVGAYIGFETLKPVDVVRIAEKSVDVLSHNLKLLYDLKDVKYTPDVLSKLLLMYDEARGGRGVNAAFEGLFQNGLSQPLLDLRARVNGFENAQPGDVLLVDLDDVNPGKLKVKSVAPAEIAKVEALNARYPIVTSALSKEAIIDTRSKANGVKRETWGMTSELVTETIHKYANDKKMLIEPRTFKLLKGRR